MHDVKKLRDYFYELQNFWSKLVSEITSYCSENNCIYNINHHAFIILEYDNLLQNIRGKENEKIQRRIT